MYELMYNVIFTFYVVGYTFNKKATNQILISRFFIEPRKQICNKDNAVYATFFGKLLGNKMYNTYNYFFVK